MTVTLWIECHDDGSTTEAVGVWVGDGYDFPAEYEQPVCVRKGHDFDVLGGA